MTDKTSRLIETRKEKLLALKEKQVNLFPNNFKVLHSIQDIKAAIDNPEIVITDDAPRFVVSGRMMAINRFGKASFIRFRDRTGQLQAYIRKDRIGDAAYDFFKQMDIGDFIGLSGVVFQTKTGEWTLLADDLKLVCKATRPLPEKFHGLKDPEKRYRQRYLDLVMNPDTREIFEKRSRIIQAIRDHSFPHPGWPF